MSVIDKSSHKDISILICGVFDQGPIGRHTYTWLYALIEDKGIKITLCPINKITKKEIFKSDFLDKIKTPSSLNAINFIDIEKKITDSFDFAIFTDPISIFSVHRTKFVNSFIKVKSYLKIAYVVHDGSFPPIEWVDTLNKHFDVCFTPSQYVADTFKDYGIQIPCSCIPCGVFSTPLQKVNSVTQKKITPDNSNFKFCLICGMDSRKKPLEFLEAFISEFSPQEKVELIIHSQYTTEPNYALSFERKVHIAKINGFNIRYSFGSISQKDLENIYQEIDVYASVQNASGYFTTICEALLLGKAIIYSDIPVHQELFSDISDNLEDLDIFPVKCPILTPTLYPFYASRTLGLSLNFDEASLKKILRKAYCRRKNIYLSKKIERRISISNKFHISNIAILYQQFIQPEKLYACDELKVSFELITYPRSILDKMLRVYPSLKIDENIITQKTTSTYQIEDVISYKIINSILHKLHKKETEFIKSKNNREISENVSLELLLINKIKEHGIKKIFLRSVILLLSVCYKKFRILYWNRT